MISDSGPAARDFAPGICSGSPCVGEEEPISIGASPAVVVVVVDGGGP